MHKQGSCFFARTAASDTNKWAPVQNWMHGEGRGEEAGPTWQQNRRCGLGKDLQEQTRRQKRLGVHHMVSSNSTLMDLSPNSFT